MSGRYGGGGVKCVVCGKTAYGGETLYFEKKPYHVNCMRCTTCKKKMGPDKCALHEDKLYCRRCYAKNGFAQKSTKVKWKKKKYWQWWGR